MSPIDVLRRMASNSDRTVQIAQETREGIANLATVLEAKLSELIKTQDNHQRLLDEQLQVLIEQSRLLDERLTGVAQAVAALPRTSSKSLEVGDIMREVRLSVTGQSRALEVKLDALIDAVKGVKT